MHLGRRTRTGIWLFCLAAAFVTTHLPPPDVPAPPLINDKLEHFLGFTALGIVTAWRATGTSRPIRVAMLIRWLAGLAAYGLFDETTQPYFRRTFEWGDWAADICGAVFGIAVAVLCHRWTTRTREERAVVQQK